MKFDYLIVGSGLYGCVFAHEMQKRGHSILLIEKRNEIGGNVHSSLKRGIQVHDYGAHIFHTSDKEVWDYIGNFVTMNRYTNSPVAFYKGETYNLPFNMNTFNRMWGVRTPKEAEEKIKEQSELAVREIIAKRRSIKPSEVSCDEIRDFKADNLEEQGLFLAGKDIFEKLIKGYTEKQWGRSCGELPGFIISRLPFRFIYDNNYFNDSYQGIPREGYTAFCERLLGIDRSFKAEDCENAKPIELRLGTSLKDVLIFKNDLPEEENGYFISGNGDTFKHIVYTGRIDEFFSFKEGRLEYRSLRFETEDLPDVDNYQGNAVVNYTERSVPYTRIIEHKHFLFGEGEGTVITREYPETYEEGKEPYYPINDEANNSVYEKYEELAKKYKNISFGGRLGTYKYYNMDQVIRQALDDSRRQ